MSNRRLIIRAVLSSLVAVLLALGAWHGASTLAADAVVVEVDARPVICTGDQVGVSTLEFPDDGDELSDRYIHTIDITTGLDCTLRHWVVNNSAVDITIDSAEYLLLGNSAVGVSVTSINGFDVPGDSRDARSQFTGRFFIAPGERQLLLATLRFNPDGCASPGSIQSIPRSPIVTFDALGIAQSQSLTSGEVGFVGTGGSSCADVDD